MTERNDIEQLFKAHYPQMHHLAMALLHDADLARDIVHDVFVSLLDGKAPGSDARGDCSYPESVFQSSSGT